MSDITIKFFEYEFDGLKFSKYEEFPWKNKVEREDVYDKLYDEFTEESRFKFKKLSEREAKQKIHINLSRHYISKWLAFGLALLTLIFILGDASTMINNIIIGTSLISMGFALIFFRKAKNEYNNIGLGEMMIDLIFDLEKQEING